MSKPTDEQVKEFWEKCGFKRDSIIEHWDYPDGSPYSQLPPTDLNNLFKYAVPKVYEYLCRKGDYYKMRRIYKSIEYQDKLGEYNPALALFWALWEVMKNG
ncbi:hypothetical protein LCGC14_0408870 [marine sediment metagenome]|uniref:Uncharacterized protein n=1 Tax=marine sediment metagenome TaxID=412755 RepID=A0A0F9SUJ4_9ZZZZ